MTQLTSSFIDVVAKGAVKLKELNTSISFYKNVPRTPQGEAFVNFMEGQIAGLADPQKKRSFGKLLYIAVFAALDAAGYTLKDPSTRTKTYSPSAG